MTSTVMPIVLIIFSLFVFLGETGGGEGEMAFAQTATPANPIAVSSITNGDSDGVGGTFDELVFPFAITTVQIGSDTYALVTAFVGDGVQIINITNPAAPIATSSISNGSTFDELDGPRGITTVTIGEFTYALVASSGGSGVQIINITNPAAPTAVASISDGDSDGGTGTFDELDGAIGITTVTIGSSTYALVASQTDDGVQIINITDPTAPTAVASITDDSTFDELDGAIGITTVTIGSSTYALVASFFDDGVQIINITNPATPTAVSSITDGSTFDELDGVNDITTVKIGQSTYALATSGLDDGIQIIDITTPATPTAASSITDGSTFDELDGVNDITTVKIGSSTYALIASINDSGVQIINITNPATPTATSSITDGSTFDNLLGASGITTVQIGQSIYALVASQNDLGVQIILLSEPIPIPLQQETVALTMTIEQPTLPAIMFNDATVNIVLDDAGVGYLELASLIGDPIVITENANNNETIQFQFDMTGPYSTANPDASGAVTETPFEIQNFASGAHELVYNRTHIMFDFDDPNFTGLSPSVTIEASLHSAYDVFPFIHQDLGDLRFNITDILLCAHTVGAVSIDFGNIRVGVTTNLDDDGTIAIKNSGSMSNMVKIGADHWCSEGACIINNNVITTQMDNSQTRFATSPNVEYADKKAEFENFGYDQNAAGNIIRGSPAFPFMTHDLFSLIPGENSTGTAYLQVDVALRPILGLEQNRFTGSVSQEIVIESDCNTS